MRGIRGTFTFVTAVAIIGLLVLNWRAQVQTQQKLDALAALGAERSVAVAATPAPTPTPVPAPVAPPVAVPRELQKIALPPYVIEAPDQLSIEVAVKDPKTGKTNPLPTQPISGPFQVRPDGTVGLGAWGSVALTGRTLEEAVSAVRNHVAKRAENVPAENLVVIVDVRAYNSKAYYVIADSNTSKQNVIRLPITGGDTVLDALANVSGLLDQGHKLSIRIARPGKNGGVAQMLPVDWEGITQHGVTYTNYQILPGDRLHVTRDSD